MKEESFKAIKPIFLPTCLKQRKNNYKNGKAAHVDMRGFFSTQPAAACPFFS